MRRSVAAALCVYYLLLGLYQLTFLVEATYIIFVAIGSFATGFVIMISSLSPTQGKKVAAAAALGEGIGFVWSCIGWSAGNDGAALYWLVVVGAFVFVPVVTLIAVALAEVMARRRLNRAG